MKVVHHDVLDLYPDTAKSNPSCRRLYKRQEVKNVKT
eukprot:SAG11_NODE_31051_length_295_cov_0.969388_1_plen_36_part_10